MVHGRPSDVEGLDRDVTAVITSVMDINTVCVNEILTCLKKVKIVYLDTVLDRKRMRMIHDFGFSRVPVAISE